MDKAVHLLYRGIVHVAGRASEIEEAGEVAMAYLDKEAGQTYTVEDRHDVYVVAVLPPKR